MLNVFPGKVLSIQAEALCTQIFSAQVFLCEYPARHLSILKSPRAKDEGAVAEKSTLNTKPERWSWGRMQKEACVFPPEWGWRWGGQFKTMLCDAHLYNRSSWRLRSPPATATPFFFSSCRSSAHTHFHAQTTTHRLPRELLNTAPASALDVGRSNRL